MDWVRAAAAAGVLIAAGCQTTEDYAGSGPITLAPHIEEHFQKYLGEENGYAYAVAVDGRSGAGFVYCKENVCSQGTDRRWSAIETCEKFSKGVPCKVYAVRKEIVWNFGGEKPDLSSRNVDLGSPPQDRLHTERVWLNLEQRSAFRDYLKTLQRGEYPVGVYLTSDDGSYAWQTGRRAEAAVERAYKTALERCREHSKLPHTCRVFAIGNRLAANGLAVTGSTTNVMVPESSELVEDVEAVPQNIRVVWRSLSDPFEFVAKPVYEDKAWRFTFSPPDRDVTCDAEASPNRYGIGDWAIDCRNGLRASGSIRYDMRSRASTSTGTDTEDQDVFVYSSPVL